MIALTVADALEVLRTGEGSTYALACIAALNETVDAGWAPHTHRALAALAKSRTRPEGPLVAGCLRAYADGGLPEVYLWAEYPKATSANAPEARRLATELYADCYLVFADFVAAWNRRQIRQVG